MWNSFVRPTLVTRARGEPIFDLVGLKKWSSFPSGRLPDRNGSLDRVAPPPPRRRRIFLKRPWAPDSQAATSKGMDAGGSGGEDEPGSQASSKDRGGAAQRHPGHARPDRRGVRETHRNSLL